MVAQRTYSVRLHLADADESGYWADVPALPGCHTQGETVEQCLERIREAIQGHLETLVMLGEPIPNDEGVLDARVSVELAVA